jgi:hypothetical protein
MIKKIIKLYYDFFDKKLNNSTLVVLIISAFVLSVWVFIPNNWIISASYKTNIIESNNRERPESIIIINWKKYRLILEEI